MARQGQKNDWSWTGHKDYLRRHTLQSYPHLYCIPWLFLLHLSLISNVINFISVFLRGQRRKHLDFVRVSIVHVNLSVYS